MDVVSQHEGEGVLLEPKNVARMIADAFVSVSSSYPEQDGGGGGFVLCLSYLPSSLSSLVEFALSSCKDDPNVEWPDGILIKIGRNDLCSSLVASGGGALAGLSGLANSAVRRRPMSMVRGVGGGGGLPSDGLAEVEEASLTRFVEDDRVHEVCRMLRASKSIYLRVEKSPESSDLEHRNRLQLRLTALCRRTLSSGVGRGMLIMGSLEPLTAEALPIPPIILAGRVPPSNSAVMLDVAQTTPDLTLWPDFHNGVAAGLRVGKASSSSTGKGKGGKGKEKGRLITRNWIIYNRTVAACAETDTATSSHAGVLLALGLLGHLQVLSVADLCDYLTQGHEPTSIAILIGIAASKIGMADPRLTKTLCMHIPSMLPSKHWDIEISPLVQISALVGLGLLHTGSGHRLMTEFLLAELSRRPTTDRCETREAMAFAAAWALGMVLIGKGCPTTLANNNNNNNSSSEGAASSPRRTSTSGGKPSTGLVGLLDLRIEERLYQLIDGGKRPPDSLLFPMPPPPPDAHSKPSRILEGDEINTDITAPGAIVAISLIYMKSNNAEVAKRIKLPNTVCAIDAIRPDMLLFRAMGQCLVMWDECVPTAEWIDSQVPEVIRKVMFPPSTTAAVRTNFASISLSAAAAAAEAAATAAAAEQEKEKVNALFGVVTPKLTGKVALCAYLHIISGYCYGLGLVYAGTNDLGVRDAILSKLRLLQSLRDAKPIIVVPAPIEKAMRPMLDLCVCICSVSLAAVMAGSGDLVCLRILRELRWKIEDVVYGTHMAINMALGLLFLAGGNASLRRDSLGTACLLLSICPRFPSRTTDNQYQLQPLRHMYVLAVERRALQTVDVDSGQPISLDVEVIMADGNKRAMKAPCLLPELSTVKEVRVLGKEEILSSSSSIAPSVSAKAAASAIQDVYETSIAITQTAAEGGNTLMPHQQIQRDIEVPPLRIKLRQEDDPTQISSSDNNFSSMFGKGGEVLGLSSRLTTMLTSSLSRTTTTAGQTAKTNTRAFSRELLLELLQEGGSNGDEVEGELCTAIESTSIFSSLLL